MAVVFGGLDVGQVFQLDIPMINTSKEANPVARNQIIAGSVYSPKTSFKASQISPSVA